MAPRRRALLLAVLLLSPLAARNAHAGSLRWSKRLFGCEPPSVFYSASHRPGSQPCCATEVGLCAGGTACPAGGTCADGMACQPGTQPARPNLVLFISDDQAECAWGSAGECRSSDSGTPIPPPSTPNLDMLSGYGTVFTLAHNTAAWCFPSLNTILTGRYQRSFGGVQRVAEAFATIPRSLRSLNGAPGTQADPYHPESAIGGYCTFLGGKFAAAVGDAGFDALANSRKLARTNCYYDPSGGPPLCGSRAQSTYSPTRIFNQGELFTFLESLIHPLPDAPGQYRMSPFFAWYAPRIPHAPLNAPVAIDYWLFGKGGFPGLGGLMNLGQYCNGATCAPVVKAFDEINIGLQSDYWSSVWWTDDALREIREYIGRAGAPHCIGADGIGRYEVTSPERCPGTWATSVSPDLERNTIYMYLTDNGWFLPNSKHTFSENGYRTRILVYDPRNLPTLPPSTADGATIPPVRNSDAMAHSSDVLPTLVGYALGTPGTQGCPVGSDGKPCDGRDLRPYVYDPAGHAAQPAGNLRHALCGHQTQKGVSPTNVRYLVTGNGGVGRCTDLTGDACSTAAQCGPGRTCLGGHCTTSVAQSCAAGIPCPAGAVCLGGQCVGGPSCIDDDACGEILGPGSWACVEPEQKWCRNAPDVRCTTRDDCPACPAGPGASAPPCNRLCEARRLKLYISPAVVTGAVPSPKLTDLFLDPDENGLERDRPGSLISDLSKKNGPFHGTMSRLSCCSDEWWPEVAAQAGTICSGSCNPKFSCVQ